MGSPRIGPEGKLWLRDGDPGDRKRDGERLSLQVFRKVIDEIPLLVETRIDLEVSGRQRELVLGRALLPQFIPLSLTSPLPTRLEPDGRLRAQVRPGSWSIQLSARFPAETTHIALGKNLSPWPDSEIWVFDARPKLRLVEVQGVISIDPRQTRLPGEWQHLPTYRLQAGDGLRLEVIRRGDPEPDPDALHLQRELWLDFDGGGYTVADTISGRMLRAWRLNAGNDLKLGRVSLDGQAQFITRLPGSDQEGVEVRRGSIDLSADSRYEGRVRSTNAVGWDHDFDQVSATLHLPPGWRLFAAAGVDNVPDSWVSRWTLLDLFVVLIAALAFGHLWGWPWEVVGAHRPGTELARMGCASLRVGARAGIGGLSPSPTRGTPSLGGHALSQCQLARVGRDRRWISDQPGQDGDLPATGTAACGARRGASNRGAARICFGTRGRRDGAGREQ